MSARHLDSIQKSSVTPICAYQPINQNRNALHFKHKIQRRQLRVHHPNDHFWSAISIRNEWNVMLFFCDDKVKAPGQVKETLFQQEF
jgi:hypothetical protein